MVRPAQPLWKIALSRVLARPQLVIGLWLLSLIGAALALLPTGLTLFSQLALRPAAQLLARGQGDVLASELLYSSTGVTAFAPMFVGSLLVSSLLFWLLSSVLSGGLVAALLRPGHPAHAPPGRVLSRAIETAVPMLRLELLGLLVLRLPLLVVVAVAAFLLGHRPEVVELTAQAFALRFLPLVVLSAWLWSATSIVLHYARILQLSGSAVSTFAALRGGLRLATQGKKTLRATLALGLVSMAGYALLLTLGLLTASALDVTLFVGLAFIVRQLFALLRSLLALWLIAAATEVWHDLAGQLPARPPPAGL